MVNVDGVLVDGRPEDGKHWQTFLEHDFGITPELLRQEFFEPYWEDIVLGRAALMDHLAPVQTNLSHIGLNRIHVLCVRFCTHFH